MKHLFFIVAIICPILFSCNNEMKEITETPPSTNNSSNDSSSANSAVNTKDTTPATKTAEVKPEKPVAGPSTPIELTDASFDNMVLKSDKIVVVDFWATWCKPCLMIAPSMKELASEYAGKVVIGKLDVDKNPKTAQKYQINSIPMVMFFKNGKLVDKLMGAMPKSEYKAKIDKVLGS
jgi:thioredoxin 1